VLIVSAKLEKKFNKDARKYYYQEFLKQVMRIRKVGWGQLNLICSPEI